MRRLRFPEPEQIAPEEIRPGAAFECSRTFDRASIQDFSRITGDHGAHHTEGERLIAHGLLVSSLVTKIGGDLNYVSKDMHMEFLGPVYEGETVTGRLTLEAVIEQKRRRKVRMTCELFKNDGTLVVRGGSHGQIWKR